MLPVRSCSTVKSRPRYGDTPRVRRKPAFTIDATIRSGSVARVRLNCWSFITARPENDRFSASQAETSGVYGWPSGCFGEGRVIATSRSGLAYGSGRSRTASIALNRAVVAPIPSARVRTAMAVKPGARRRTRAA